MTGGYEIALRVLQSIVESQRSPFESLIFTILPFFKRKPNSFLPGIPEEFKEAISNPDDAEQAVRILDVHSRATDNQSRKAYGAKILTLSRWWLVLAIITVWAAALKLDPNPVLILGYTIDIGPFVLSDAVLIALITTTTANVLGLMYTVANYLFPSKTPTAPKT